MKYFPLIICALLLVACQKEDKLSRQELVQAEVNKRVERFTSGETRKCQQNLIREIEYEVDSLMYYLVRKKTGEEDNVIRPNRPPRPVDTIKLETIHKETPQ